jgi:hypothetical protein
MLVLTLGLFDHILMLQNLKFERLAADSHE